jgi:hypothetical protein
VATVLGIFVAGATPLAYVLLGIGAFGYGWSRLKLGKSFTFPFVITLHMPVIVGVAVGVFAVSIFIRFTATMRYLYAGFRALPRNFRALIICTSPTQEPELVPGVSPTESEFTFSSVIREFGIRRRYGPLDQRMIALAYFPPAILVWFLPAWIYRLTLKSTSWFWWPLAFLGSELRRARHPELFRQKIMETLWARTTIILGTAIIVTFLVSNLWSIWIGFGSNPFLIVVEYLFVIEWSARSWQLFSIASALLSFVIVLWMDDVSRTYSYAQTAEALHLLIRCNRQFGWIERLTRIRLLFVISFWLLVGAHTLLYFNSHECWIKLPDNVIAKARWVYGDRLPPLNCP